MQCDTTTRHFVNFGGAQKKRMLGLTNARDFPVPIPPRGGCRYRVPRWEVQSSSHHQLARKVKSMTILCAGIDLAKNVFALHGVNAGGAVVLRTPKLS